MTSRGAESRAPAGVNIYAMAIVVRAQSADIGPTEWNLRNASGKYTVVIAMYYNMTGLGLLDTYKNRKEDAVDYCKRLRAAGKEAYFLHDPAKSYVSIGTFDEPAIVSVRRGYVPKHGWQFVKQIRDARMRAILRQYPKLAVNGREEITYVPNPKTGKKDKVITASYPMEIPHR